MMVYRGIMEASSMADRVAAALMILVLAAAGSAWAAVDTVSSPAAADSQWAGELPPSVPTALIIAGAMSEGGDYDGALRYYRYALQHAPGDLEIGQKFVGLALRTGRLGDALAGLNTLLEHHPGDRDLSLQKVRLLLLGGRVDDADELSRSLLEDFPDDFEVLSLRVEILERQGRLDEALRLQSERWKEDPHDPQISRAYATLLLRSSSPEQKSQGEAILRRLLDEDPTDAVSAEILVKGLREEGRNEEAIAVLEGLVERTPVNEEQARLLADLYLAQGRESEACDLLLPLAREGLLDRHGLIVLTDLLVRQERYDEAWELGRSFLQKGESDGVVLQMVGEIAMEQGELESAETALSRALKLRPNDPEILVSLLLAMSRRYPELAGSKADAAKGEEKADERVRERYRRLLNLAQGTVEEDSFRQNLILGALLRRAGRSQEAIIPLSRAVDLRGDNTQALWDLAWAQQETGQIDEACATLDRLVKLQPHDAVLLNFYGYLLADHDRELARARAMIEEAVKQEPENPYYLDSLGWVLYRQGHYEEALDRLIDASNRIGDDLTVLEHTGDVLSALGRHDTALEIYRRALRLGGDAKVLQPKIDAAEEALKHAP